MTPLKILWDPIRFTLIRFEKDLSIPIVMVLLQLRERKREIQMPIHQDTTAIITPPEGKLDFLPQQNPTLNEKGQSTIEFLLTFIFVFSLIFMIFKIGVTFSNGYLVHYATFMASRTYLVIDNNSNSPSGGDQNARNRASAVFEKFPMKSTIPGWTSLIKINHPGSVPNNLFVGAWSEYTENFGISDIVGGIKPIVLRSESFLGREPTRANCLQRICRAMEEVGGDCSVHTTFFDNGC